MVPLVTDAEHGYGLYGPRAAPAGRLVFVRRGRFGYVVHNLIAHPLLVLCPPLGRWLHDRTI